MLYSGTLLAEIKERKNLPKGFSQLPMRLQNALLHPKSQISNVSADIVQYTVIAGSSETRKGYFRADSKGRFRIDYTSPDEQVVFDGKTLYWDIKENGFVWEIPELSADSPVQAQAIPEKPAFLSNEFEIRKENKPWSAYLPGFSEGEYFSVKSNKTRLIIYMRYNYEVGAVTSRRVVDHQGNEILTENLEDPVLFRQTAFFKKSKVIAGNLQTGKKLLSQTTYHNLKFNTKMPAAIFMKPKGKIKLYQSR